MAALKKGNLVRLTALAACAELNGAEGVVTGAAEGEPPRYPVRLLRPEAAAAAHPQGVRVRRANLELLQQPGAGAGAGSSRCPAGGAASSSGAPTAPAGGGAAGGNRGAGATSGGARRGSLDAATRQRVAQECVHRFLKALDADLYPEEALERLFGVRMQRRNNAGDLSSWPTGSLTLGAWITIRNWYLHDKAPGYEPDAADGDGDGEDGLSTLFGRTVSDAALRRARRELEDEVVGALLGGCLPAWYRERLLALRADGRASAYAEEIISRGFRDIPWDVELMDRIAGVA